MKRYITYARESHFFCFSLIISLLFCGSFGLLTNAFSNEKSMKHGGEPVLNIYNIHDRPVGAVSSEGVITNRYERALGSVDDTGVIYNVSDIVIGNVDMEGKVINQSGTKMGHVNKDGEIFNVSGRKVGFVRDVDNIFLIGGAARLLFLK